MVQWLKKHTTIIVTTLVCFVFVIYLYGCDSKVRSLNDTKRLVNRQELQLELNHFIDMAQIRMLDLDKQDALKSIVLQNALILVQGQPLNPFGIITAVAAVYGAAQGSRNVTKVVKNRIIKRKVNNGTA